jgi:hypothetical protein
MPEESMASTTSVPAATEAPAEQLAPGWEKRVNATGREFFVDHNTQSTQWDPPMSTTQVPATEVPTIDVPSLAPELGPVLGFVSQQLPAGWVTPAPSASFDELPPSSAFFKTGDYYVDRNTESTQWDPPLAPSGPQASAVSASSPEVVAIGLMDPPTDKTLPAARMQKFLGLAEDRKFEDAEVVD